MSRTHTLVITACALLFTIITVLFSIEPHTTGRATTATTVQIQNSTPANCSVIAGLGINTISFFCISSAQALTDVFTDDTDIAAIYRYVSSTSDKWRVYNPNLPAYVQNDLTVLSRSVGYVLVLNASRNYTYQGLAIESTNVPMVTGWNLVGYPSPSVQNASISFSSIDNFTEARTYNNTAAVYLSYQNPGGGSLTQTVPGQGYWINATQGLTWVVS